MSLEMTLGILFGVMLAVALVFVLAPALKNKAKGANMLPLLVGVFVVAAAGGIYYMLGSPEDATPPHFPAGFGDEAFGPDDQSNMPSVDAMIDKLKERLKEDPESIEGWSLLGQSMMVMGRYSEAADAYQKAVDLAPDVAEFHSGVGEALILMADGTVTEDAAEAFKTALSLDPVDPIARFYLGDYDFQHANYQEAYDRWFALFDELPVDTPWLNLLDQRIRQAADKLDIDVPNSVDDKMADATAAREQDVAQEGMSQEDQKAMIEGMVTQLAARLEEDPSDMDGWMRLGRSYMVLGRHADAADAYMHVVKAKPDDANALNYYLQAVLSDNELSGAPITDETIEYLKKLEGLDSENTTALYYLGVAAAQAGNNGDAKGYWIRLLKTLPEGSMDAKFVQDKIDGLGD